MNIPVENTVENTVSKGAGPDHVAIIMDGNGRWAKARRMPRAEGHRKGSKAVRKAIKGAVECGISYLTIYAFSTENWNRSVEEVSDLMGLLRHYLKNEIKSLNKEKVKLRIIGDRTGLDSDIQTMIEEAEKLTAANDRLTLAIALNYGSRDEIVTAVKAISDKVNSGVINSSDISEEMLSDHLYTHDIPDPDLVIRTSGEMRVSNFLLWQIAYSEFMFLDVLWPDFNENHMQQAVADYAQRDRRFGGRNEAAVEVSAESQQE